MIRVDFCLCEHWQKLHSFLGNKPVSQLHAYEAVLGSKRRAELNVQSCLETRKRFAVKVMNDVPMIEGKYRQGDKEK